MTLKNRLRKWYFKADKWVWKFIVKMDRDYIVLLDGMNENKITIKLLTSYSGTILEFQFIDDVNGLSIFEYSVLTGGKKSKFFDYYIGKVIRDFSIRALDDYRKANSEQPNKE